MNIHGLMEKLSVIFMKDKINFYAVMEGTEGAPFITNCQTYLRDGVRIAEPIMCTRFEYNGMKGMAMPGQEIPAGAKNLGPVVLLRPTKESVDFRKI